MRVESWLTAFKPLHQQASNGRLIGPPAQQYRELREEMTRAFLASQAAERPGEELRRSIRVAKVLPAELELAGRRERLLTLSLSSGGFSALAPRDPGERPVAFSLQMPRGQPVVGHVHAVAVKRRTGAYHV